MMNGFTERSPEEDESQILSLLGSTAASAAVYEQSVLRDAKLKSAPQIVLPQSTIAAVHISTRHNSSNNLLVACGDDQPSFPDLSSLSPSTSTSSRNKIDAQADLPHVLRVLSRTRDLLQCTLSSSNDMHHMGKGEVSENEQQKRREIDMLYMKEQILLSYLTDVVGLKEDDAVIPQRKCEYGARRLQANSNVGDDYYVNSDMHDAVGNSNKNDADQHLEEALTDPPPHFSSSNRLDRIKKGEAIDLLEKRPSKRNTVMSLKSRMRIENGLTPLKSMDEERFDEEKSRKRRNDRKKRQLQRQKAALGMGGSSEEEDAEAEFATTSHGIIKKKNDNVMDSACDTTTHKNGNQPGPKVHDEQTKKKNGVHWAGLNEQSIQDISPDVKKRTHTKVFCPICQLSFSVQSKGEGAEAPDEFLAKHLDECQKSSSTCNRSRTLRKRKKPVVFGFDRGDTAEFDADEPDATYSTSEVDCEANHESKPPPHRPIDDMDEFDYEERVDDWVERGLERMKNMAERDYSESPPGTVVYEGGLEIPAWVNDRLFPYQRAGVRWMWELHCQGVGGVGK